MKKMPLSTKSEWSCRVMKSTAHLAYFALLSSLCSPPGAINALANNIEEVPRAARPVVFWTSGPTRPNQTVMMLGNRLAEACQYELWRLPDGDMGMTVDGNTDAITAEAVWNAWQPDSADGQSAKALLPNDLEMGVFAIRVGAGPDNMSKPVFLNAPDPWWLQADEGPAATRGGWVRIFGTCLAFDAKPRVLLRDAEGTGRLLPVAAASRWELGVRIPDDMATGPQEVFVHNGHGGPKMWRLAGVVEVIDAIGWKTDVFEVATGASAQGNEAGIVAALAKAEANGGGVVLLRRGTYTMKGMITIPPRTTLRGEDTALVSLHWPDIAEPEGPLIRANDCAIQDLAIYCQNHAKVIESGSRSTRFRLNRVRIRADAFARHTGPGLTHAGRTAPEKFVRSHAVRILGKNFQVTECDLYGSGEVISIDPIPFAGRFRPFYGVIRANRIVYGMQGHTFENVDRLIFEGNELAGRGTTAGGNGISTFWSNFSRHIFYARNHSHDFYGVDRETLTLDGDGGAYFGKALAEGTDLVLESDPLFRDYAPQPHTDYRGAVVYILEGTGAGQYRFVAGHEGRRWAVDRAWDVPPDASSLFSIVPFRGRNLFIGNRCEDAGPIQLYGSAADVIVAENTGARIDGMFAWGLTQHGWGWHPAFRCQFLDNTLTEGSGYGVQVWGPAFIGVKTLGNNEKYQGPLARGMIFRGNRLAANGLIDIRGTVVDVIVERNEISRSATGVRVSATARGVLLRANTFDDVATPYADAAERWVKEAGPR